MWVAGANELWHVIGNFSDQWYWIPLATMYTLVLNEYFVHLIIAHQAFKVNTGSWFYKLLIWLATIDNGYGKIIGNVVMHDKHHDCSDIVGQDPIHAQTNWWTTGSLTPLMYIYQPKLHYDDFGGFVEQQRNRYQNIVNDSWTKFCDDHGVLITVISWSLLFLLVPELLFKILFMGRVFLSIMQSSLVLITHRTGLLGYRNFDVIGSSHNNMLLHSILLFMVPSALHNNHHGHPDFAKSHGYRWWEIDLGSKFINLVMKPLLVQRN